MAKKPKPKDKAAEAEKAPQGAVAVPDAPPVEEVSEEERAARRAEAAERLKQIDQRVEEAKTNVVRATGYALDERPGPTGIDRKADPAVVAALLPYFAAVSSALPKSEAIVEARRALVDAGCDMSTFAYLGIRPNGDAGLCHVWSAYQPAGA